jgi:hypothetical protein
MSVDHLPKLQINSPKMTCNSNTSSLQEAASDANIKPSLLLADSKRVPHPLIEYIHSAFEKSLYAK